MFDSSFRYRVSSFVMSFCYGVSSFGDTDTPRSTRRIAGSPRLPFRRFAMSFHRSPFRHFIYMAFRRFDSST